MLFKKMTCSVTSIFMAVLLIVLSVLAPVGALSTISTTNISKIDSVLIEKMETMKDDDTVLVSVWFEDIDYDEVKVGVEQELKNNTRALFNKGGFCHE